MLNWELMKANMGSRPRGKRRVPRLKASSLFLRSHVGHSFNPEPSYLVLEMCWWCHGHHWTGKLTSQGGIAQSLCWGNLDPTSLDGLIDLVSNVALGEAKERSADVLGHIFEYFLDEFSLAEGRKGRQFYTSRSVDVISIYGQERN